MLARDSQPAEHSAQGADDVRGSLRRGDLAALLRPMEAYFASMAGAAGHGLGAGRGAAAHQRQRLIAGAEVYVDLADFIDVAAEIARKERSWKAREARSLPRRGNWPTRILSAGPAEVIEKERAALAQLASLRGRPRRRRWPLLR